MSTLTKPVHASRPDDYLELVMAFPLKALRNDQQHAEAVKLLTRLLGRANEQLTVGQRDYVDVLGRLIQDYDQRKHTFARHKHTPLEFLRFLMHENGMSTADLGEVLGNKTAASLVLNGKRELSKSHIRRLAARFKVEPGLFF
jgi:HTH-type transcriptional regulator/antitoxin HigA